MTSALAFIKFEIRRFVGFIKKEFSKESGAHGLFILYILFRRFINALFYIGLGIGVTVLARMNIETLAETLFGRGAEGTVGKWLTATFGKTPIGGRLVEIVNRRVIDTYGKTVIEYAGRIGGGLIAITVGVFVFYGLLSLVIALGLYYRRKWAEYVIVAASFVYVPVEIFAIVAYRSWSAVGALVFNLFVIWYLCKKKKLFSGYFSFHPDKHFIMDKMKADKPCQKLPKTG